MVLSKLTIFTTALIIFSSHVQNVTIPDAVSLKFIQQKKSVMKLILKLSILGILFSSTVFGQEWNQVSKTLPYAAGYGTELDYGHSVAINGEYAVIGEPGYNDNQGCAYILNFDGGTWNTIDTLVSSLPHPEAYFGYDVAIEDDVIVIGCENDKNNVGSSGMVYVYEKPESGWQYMTETAQLSGSLDKSLSLGTSVAIYGDVIVAGAPGHYQDEKSMGAVYVFEKEGEHWESGTETAVLIGENPRNSSELGFSVDIYDDIIVAGARASGKYGIYSGEAMYWLKEGDNWVNDTASIELTPKIIEKNSMYGFSVAVDDSLIVVSAVNYDFEEKDNGIAYLFERTGEDWTSISESYLLKSSTPSYQKYFGSDVDISGQTVLVGARQDATTAYNAGAAYLFEKPATGWADTTESALFTAEDGVSHDRFGSSVAIAENHIAIGAYDCDDIYNDGGAVYFYTDQELTGISNNIRETSFSIYPNPSKGVFKVETTTGILEKITVFDITGKQICIKNNIRDNFSVIDISDSSGGIYFIKIETSKGESIKKIIHQ